jgi:hypothetical protein
MSSKVGGAVTMAAAQGERIAGFILITGIDGTRFAVRQHTISVIHDADECHDERWCTCMAVRCPGAVLAR